MNQNLNEPSEYIELLDYAMQTQIIRCVSLDWRGLFSFCSVLFFTKCLSPFFARISLPVSLFCKFAIVITQWICNMENKHASIVGSPVNLFHECLLVRRCLRWLLVLFFCVCSRPFMINGVKLKNGSSHKNRNANRKNRSIYNDTVAKKHDAPISRHMPMRHRRFFFAYIV